MRALLCLALIAALATPAFAGPLTGKTWIIQMSSSQSARGLDDFLLPPLAMVLRSSDMRPTRGPNADVVVNVVTASELGRSVERGAEHEWIYTLSVTVGISPGDYVIPFEGTPVFGVRAVLVTPYPDNYGEMRCLIRLAARAALANYRPEGMLKADASSCRRD